MQNLSLHHFLLLTYIHRYKYSSLWIQVIMSEKWTLIYQTVCAIFSSIMTLASPYFLYQITGYITDPAGKPASMAFGYAFMLGLVTLTKAFLDAQTWFVGVGMDIRLRSILVNEIYTKSLRRAAAASSSPSGSTSETSNSEEDDSDDDDDDEGENQGDSGPTTTGKIMTLMSTDTDIIHETFGDIYFIVIAPLQILATIGALLSIIGWPALIGLASTLLTLPATTLQSALFNKAYDGLLQAKDKRTNAVNEVLQGIRIIKFFGWEQKFLNKIQDARQFELKALIQYYIQLAFGIMIWLTAPLLVSLTTFITLTVFAGQELNAQLAFTCIALFNTLRLPLAVLPDMIADFVQCKVSIGRIEKFLKQEELEKYSDFTAQQNANSGDPKSKLTVRLMAGWFQYFTVPKPSQARTTTSTPSNIEQTESSPLLPSTKTSSTDTAIDVAESPSTKIEQNAFTLRNISLDFPVGGLTSVCGPTGAGKSSVLQALLGEMKRLSGNIQFPDPRFAVPLSPDWMGQHAHQLTTGVAYVAQTSWLQNATIRDNILFGEPYDPIRYDRVLKACALVKDLETFEAGDLTEIGEKGINLSGGQKQRVSLARAVYSRAAVVLMDDPLSAVDAPTAKHLFDHVICGLLAGRTRILVTHATSLVLPQTDYLVIMQNGEVLGAGSVAEVVKMEGVEGILLKEESEYNAKEAASSSSLSTETDTKASVEKGKEAALNNTDHSSLVATQAALDALTEGIIKDYANGKTKEDARKLVETEESATGAVKFSVYLSYMKTAGGLLLLVAMFFNMILDRVILVGNDYWVKIWADAYEQAGDDATVIAAFGSNSMATASETVNWQSSNVLAPLSPLSTMHSVVASSLTWVLGAVNSTTPHLFSHGFPLSPSALGMNGGNKDDQEKHKVDTLFYVLVYSTISASYIIVFALGFAIECYGAYHASQKLHNMLLDRIMYAPMRFFEKTPLGRILNRASKDISTIDRNVMHSFGNFISRTFDAASIVAVIAFITPVFLLPALPMVLLYVYVAQRYLNSSRELKRLDSVSNSPIYSMFSETLV
jgi:ABC-type multidrug transport system fused ATPase/permease subunit